MTYEYNGFDIAIEPSADRYNAGFSWCVCVAGVEKNDGLAFTEQDAVVAAEKAADTLTAEGQTL